MKLKITAWIGATTLTLTLGAILWHGTEHGAPPCRGCDCTTPVDRPCR